MVIYVSLVAGSADTQAQGAALYEAMRSALSKAVNITVSFAGIDVATSSFVNMSFIRLLDDMRLAELKARVRVIDSTKPINDMIKKRLEEGNLWSARHWENVRD